MVRKLFLAAAAGLALFASGGGANAATFINGQGVTINTNGAKLASAEGVQVGSGTYRVDFSDALAMPFAFADAATAKDAANALLDTVLRNYMLFLADTVPGLTAGCGLLTPTCTVYVPYQLTGSDLYSAFAVNAGLIGTDSVGLAVTTTSISDTTSATFANFTLTSLPDPSSAVPEPSTWLLMMAGFGVAGSALRRGRARERRVAVA